MRTGKVKERDGRVRGYEEYEGREGNGRGEGGVRYGKGG